MRHTRIARGHEGFTLIELLVAIAILGILGTVVINQLWTNVDKAKQETTHAKVNSVWSIVQNYRRAHNGYPSQDMAELLEPDPKNVNQPWVDEENLLDSFGNRLELIEDPDNRGRMVIVSYGANGTEDGWDPTYGLDMDIYSGRPLFPSDNY